jgi:hypothetical protein
MFRIQVQSMVDRDLLQSDPLHFVDLLHGSPALQTLYDQKTKEIDHFWQFCCYKEE